MGVQKWLEIADELPRQQTEVLKEDAEEPPLFKVGDLVLLKNQRRRKGATPNCRVNLLSHIK